ncbi:hypothetical protein [Lignipirellula cremea]|uniref:hypothetical protein n=1 Tax=Lignipirellula cremea TaxID=2528010 RepID=UPI0011A83285|nr:hypothetical protein [Lignipirellula cremea]
MLVNFEQTHFEPGHFDLVQRIADAVLYEGYILYPYRASAVKNQQRFNFGVVAPPGQDEASRMRTECLVVGKAPLLTIRVRFLQAVAREAFRLVHATDPADAPQYAPTPKLEINGTVYHTWQEALERDVPAGPLALADLVAQPHAVPFRWDACQSREPLADPQADPPGEARGLLSRRQALLEGVVELSAEQLAPDLFRVAVEIRNTTPAATSCADASGEASAVLATAASAREEAILQACLSTHTLLGVEAGEFVSLMDPPETCQAAAAGCQNVGCWPVLAGAEGERRLLLSSPIILYDYPQIAPESQGDFCDGLEIDEMLALRVMTLTDAEKQEMHQLDDRSREILARTQALPNDQWQQLHGRMKPTPNPPPGDRQNDA